MRSRKNYAAEGYLHITNNRVGLVILDCGLNKYSLCIRLDVLLDDGQLLEVRKLVFAEHASNEAVIRHHSSGCGNVAMNERISCRARYT
jgi:hypothetical protein